MQVNQSVQETLSSVMEQQMLLTGKLASAMSAPILPGPTGATGATGAVYLGKMTVCKNAVPIKPPRYGY